MVQVMKAMVGAGGMIYAIVLSMLPGVKAVFAGFSVGVTDDYHLRIFSLNGRMVL